MEFCPKCGSVLMEKTKGNITCAKCNYRKKGKFKIESKEVIEEKRKIGVVKDKDTGALPVTADVCPKCTHPEAYFWTNQTRSSDEAETKFYKCVKCGNTRREYR